MRITAADFLRRFGVPFDRALFEPLIITRRGAERFILKSIDSYRALSEKPATKASRGLRKKNQRPAR